MISICSSIHPCMAIGVTQCHFHSPAVDVVMYDNAFQKPPYPITIRRSGEGECLCTQHTWPGQEIISSAPLCVVSMGGRGGYICK